MIKKEYFPALVTFLFIFLGIISQGFAKNLLDIKNLSDKDVITINIKKSNPKKVFTLNNPHRLVIDVPATHEIKNISLPRNYESGLIKSVRFGQFNTETSRFVFDLEKPVDVTGVRSKKNLLTVEIAGINKSSKKKGAYKVYESQMNYPPLIVIDAGHGGNDPGAIGKNGTLEKQIVLEYAKTLKAKLLKTKKYRVMLTRSDDHFIMLRKRIEIARKAGAALFISLHADSGSDDSARGLSVYTVSEKASDKEAEALAARENKSDIIGGMDLSHERADVADILISLAQRETMNNSALLADLLVIELGKKVDMLPNPHRFAGFAVLKAPDIPSVLIETGFISNKKEEKLLKTKSHRDKVASGIVAAINSYFSKKQTASLSQL